MMFKELISVSSLISRQLSLVAVLFMTAAVSAQTSTGTIEEPQLIAESEITVKDGLPLIDFESEVTTVVCPFRESVEYDEGRIKCGLISVPENREKPDSRIIRLLYAHIVASGRLPDDEDDDSDEEIEVREDPVVYLTGGPGVNIEPYVTRFLEHDLTKSRDLYILNQRGIGDSDELCSFYSLTSRENVTAVSLFESEVEEAERMQACFSAAKARGVDLTGYNTIENARDVMALRQALGFEQWNVWGISYGSHLGQMLTQVDPDGIRALVIDAIVPNDLSDLRRIHRWIARNYDLIYAECERQDASICDGLKARHIAAHDSLVDEPLVLEALDKEFYPSGEFAVNPGIIMLAPFSMQYEEAEHPAIPAVITALSSYAEQRDEGIFRAFSFGEEVESMLSRGMNDAIQCNDGYYAALAEIAADDLQEDFGFNQGIFTVEGAQLMAQTCIEAGLAPRNRADYQLVQSSVPTLIVNGDWDPVTPTPLAEKVAPGFTNGRLIIVPYAGHGPTRSMSECGGQVMTDFFDAPGQNLADLDASCFEDGVDAPEFLDYLYTDAALRLATLAGEDPELLVLPGSVVGITFLLTLFGFIAIVKGYVTRKFSSQSNIYQAIGPNRPRLLTLVTTLLSLIGLGLIGIGVYQTTEISGLSIIAGVAPPAGIGAFFLLLAALVGLWAVYTTFVAHRGMALRMRTKVGLPLVTIATILLTLYLMTWGITVW